MRARRVDVMNGAFKRSGAFGRRLAIAGLASATALCLSTPLIAQTNPVTAPVDEAPSQISTPDIEPPGTGTTSDGASVANVSFFGSPRVMYATTSVRVRSGPGTGFEPIGTVPHSGQVSVLGEAQNSGWYYIELSDGGRGFSAARLFADSRPAAPSTGGPATTVGGPTTTPATVDPVCFGDEVLIRMGDGRSICATLQ